MPAAKSMMRCMPSQMVLTPGSIPLTRQKATQTGDQADGLHSGSGTCPVASACSRCRLRYQSIISIACANVDTARLLSSSHSMAVCPSGGAVSRATMQLTLTKPPWPSRSCTVLVHTYCSTSHAGSVAPVPVLAGR